MTTVRLKGTWGLFDGANQNLFLQFATGTAYPKELICALDPNATVLATEASPSFFPVANNASQAIYDSFISKLEAHIGRNKNEFDFCTPRSPQPSPSASWCSLSSCFADAANYEKFGSYPAEYVGTVWTLFIAYDQWKLVGKPFYE